MPPCQRDAKLRETYRMYLEDFTHSLAATSSLTGSVKSKRNNSAVVPTMVRRAWRCRKVCYSFIIKYSDPALI